MTFPVPTIHVEAPYCPQCGSQRPEGLDDAVCVPCLNTGHSYRLVTDEADRLTRLRNWLAFWNQWGYTVKEIKEIPGFQHLTKHTFAGPSDGGAK